MNQTTNRSWIALSGLLLQVCLGSVYGWSIFVKPFKEQFGWDKPAVTLTFTLAIGCLGLAAAFGGGLLDKKGPQFVARMGALFFGIGTFLTGVAIHFSSLALIYVTYGIIAGVGIGLCYITPIAVLVKWFPDKRGLISGLAVMGFGFGAFFMTTLVPFFISSHGTAKTFYLLGIIFTVLTWFSANQMKNPPDDYMPSAWIQNTPTRKETASSLPREALKRKEFYLFWCILFVNISAGIAIISLASPFLQEVFHVDASSAGILVGLFGIFNGLGRLFWSWTSDTLGRRNVFIIFFSSQALIFALLPSITSLPLFIILGCFIYSVYGGGFSTMPAFAADTFGSRYIGTIYGWILTAWSAAAIFGPMLYATVVERRKVLVDAANHIYDMVPGYHTAFYLSALLFAFALILPHTLPKK